jgi:transcriptional regulator with PAS, ATPase and Fis domain
MLIGRSLGARRVINLIEQVAATNAPVIITGESGTGKELAAKSIHARSECGNRPFIAINCAAVPESLIESELFGDERGASTGLISDEKDVSSGRTAERSSSTK